ncbi:hypothetical protein ACQ4PT_061752 [Festuca glaucescens]
MVFSSQTGAFSPSQFTPSSTTPLTVKQIAAAQLTGPEDDEKGVPFVVDRVETDNIRVVGMVSGKAERATDVTFTIDDGTGRIDFIRWVNDAADSAETAAIQNGMYVSVIGTLKGLQDKKRATAFCVRPVTDDNEVLLHFTQCVQMHMENTKTMIYLTVRVIMVCISMKSPNDSDYQDAMNFHVDYGHIFSTIDDFHYKSAYID